MFRIWGERCAAMLPGAQYDGVLISFENYFITFFSSAFHSSACLASTGTHFANREQLSSGSKVLQLSSGTNLFMCQLSVFRYHCF